MPRTASALTPAPGYGPNTTDAAAYFNQFFALVPANTPELQEEAYRLRFDVYSRELQCPEYSPDLFPNGLEQDAYDQRSQHYLLRHEPTGAWAGNVRLVLAEPNDSQQPFPIESEAGIFLDSRFQQGLDRKHLAEISRLIVSPHFRKRYEDKEPPYCGPAFLPRYTTERRRNLPLPMLGLFAAVMRMASENDIRYLIAVMDPILNRLLRGLGMDLRPIAPPVTICGRKRVPCFGNGEEILAKVRKVSPDAWSIIHASPDS